MKGDLFFLTAQRSNDCKSFAKPVVNTLSLQVLKWDRTFFKRYAAVQLRLYGLYAVVSALRKNSSPSRITREEEYYAEEETVWCP